MAAIVAAYQDGADLLTSIKERRRNSAVTLGSQEEDKLINELEKSLVRGSDVVQSQYERDFKKLGVPFATGDGESMLQCLSQSTLANSPRRDSKVLGKLPRRRSFGGWALTPLAARRYC